MFTFLLFQTKKKVIILGTYLWNEQKNVANILELIVEWAEGSHSVPSLHPHFILHIQSINESLN